MSSNPDLQFTYTRDPENVPRDAVRFLVGDTDGNDPLLDDREIAWTLLQSGGNQKIAAALCAEAISGFFSRETDIRVGDISVAASKLAEQWRKKAEQLRDEAGHDITVFFGGVFKADTQNRSNNSALIQPEFRKGITDNPFSAQLNRAVDVLFQSQIL